jgi:hypothetical protein
MASQTPARHDAQVSASPYLSTLTQAMQSTRSTGTPSTSGGDNSKYFKNARFCDNPHFKGFKHVLSESDDLLSFVYDENHPEQGYMVVIK